MIPYLNNLVYGSNDDEKENEIKDNLLEGQKEFCTANPYEILETLKEGDGYKIYLAKSLHSDQINSYVVLRMYDKSKFISKDLKQLRQKMNVSLKLINPGIVKSLFIDQNSNCITIVQQYCKRRKFSDFYLDNPVSEDEARAILRKLLKTLSYLKMVEIKLIDFKIDKLSVNEQGELIVNCNDFSFTEKTKIILNEFSAKSSTHSFEKFINFEVRSDLEVDVRLIGQLLYYLVSGRPLPEDTDDWSVFAYHDDVTIAFRHLIFQIFNDKQYTLHEFLNGLWFNRGKKETPAFNKIGVNNLNENASFSKGSKNFQIQKHVLFEDLKKHQNEVLRRAWYSQDKIPENDCFFFNFDEVETSYLRIKKRRASE